MYFFLWPCCVVCRILVLQPGIKLTPPTVEAWSPTHWTAREFPIIVYIDKMFKIVFFHQYSSFQFSCSVMSDSLRHYGSQHTRPPCPSPTLGAHPNLCPSSW